ncbi:hypothetical protein LEP3755_01610 [Leptolyngbya sp. NIES-3755]|nr:hypothetical protein LEP3755_01610 [Leptolyngbya sp. NIES-3755]
MANITKHKPIKWQAPPAEDYPVYRHNGTDYRLVPDSAFKKMLSDKDGFFWLALGMSMTVIAAVTQIVVNSMSPPATANQPMVIEKPVVVTQEKIVPTNCLAFCGQK